MRERRRRLIALIFLVATVAGSLFFGTVQQEKPPESAQTPQQHTLGERITTSPAIEALAALPIKGRAAKTGYSRDQFSDGWQSVGTCDMRNYILARDLENEVVRSDKDCRVVSGTLHDPYSGNTIHFIRGETTSDDVQIDHVVALSDAWQKGAQQLPTEVRYRLANDPLNLLAVDGPTNNQKGDSDAASWLPPNKAYRCQYVARQIAVKRDYALWVTQAEHDAMTRVLASCPDQQLPVVINQ